MLILKACGGAVEPLECNSICEQAKLYGIDSVCKEVKRTGDLKSILSDNGQFDYIYLSAHGCANSFSSENRHVHMEWEEFASLLCVSGCMNDDCILMLSCCRGGLMQVAYTLFYSCGHISYVLGPRQSLSSIDMHICFGIFLYNIEIRKTDPVVACEKIKYATDQRFSCYDREEEEMNTNNFGNSNMIYEIYEKVCLGGGDKNKTDSETK